MKYINKIQKLLILNVILKINSHYMLKYNDLFISRVKNENIDENVILNSRIEIIKNILKNQIEKIKKELKKIKKEFINIKKQFINIEKEFINIGEQFKEIKGDNTSFNEILKKISQQNKLNEKRNELRLQQYKLYEKNNLLRVSENQLSEKKYKYQQLLINLIN
jgi:hypothetical protein